MQCIHCPELDANARGHQSEGDAGNLVMSREVSFNPPAESGIKDFFTRGSSDMHTPSTITAAGLTHFLVSPLSCVLPREQLRHGEGREQRVSSFLAAVH